MKQKTWTTLLGNCTPRDVVQDEYIVRMISRERWRILWKFDTTEQAIAAFTEWSKDSRGAAIDSLRDSLVETLSIVRLQNGNLHQDINEIINKAERALALSEEVHRSKS